MKDFDNWVIQKKVKVLNVCPYNSGLTIGQKVSFTNEYGVSFLSRVVLGFAQKNDELNGRYIYINNVSYWFPVPFNSLTLIV